MERVKVINMKKKVEAAPVDTAKEFLTALDAIVKEKGIDKNQVLEAMELALASAYKKHTGKTNGKAKVNPETGEVLSVVDEYGHTFTKHPDNGISLIGYKIPFWKEAFDMAKLLAQIMPGLHYAGWDLALTKSGWVLVEGNPCAQMVFQISEQQGFRKELEGILHEFGVTIPKTTSRG